MFMLKKLEFGALELSMIYSSDSDDSFKEKESHSSYENEDKNKELDDFIEHVMEEKITSKYTNDFHHVEEEVIGMEAHSSSSSKPPGFDNVLKEGEFPLVTVLDRVWSDHSPILLHCKKTDFGPIPFKKFHSWFDIKDFDVFVKEAWNSLSVTNVDSTMAHHVKVKELKAQFKLWFSRTKISKVSRKKSILVSLKSLNDKIDAGQATDEDKRLRVNIWHELDNRVKLESMDLFQKARVRWDVEGAENIKFFHGIINSKRSTQMIKGILHEGTWITDPLDIKSAFLNFYNDKFLCHDFSVNFPPISVVNHLSDSDRAHLDSMVTLEESKNAVWECGSQKAPGPDGFTFMFIKKYWDLLHLDIQTFVVNFFSFGSFPPGIVTKILANRLSKVIDSIISHEQSAFILGRQILDGPLILSEVIDWYKKQKKKLLLFKVDFKKAFDSNQNGMDNIIRILNAFHLASGLKININKSNLYGAGVPSSKVARIVAGTRCSVSTLPLTYLGLPIGSNMGRISNWKVLIDRFKAILSGWKANMLSLGGRLTLIKSVLGSLGLYYMSIFKAPDAVIKSLETPLEKGGLGVGSLKAFNYSLLLKWRWRMLNCPSSLWVKVLKSIHGDEASFDIKGCQSNGLWACIVGHIVGGSASLYQSRPSLSGRTQADLKNLLIDISSLDIKVGRDSPIFTLSSDNIFSVSVARKYLDDWMLHSLPHRLNLSSRGLDIDSISCPVCNGFVESNSHVFFSCTSASNIWRFDTLAGNPVKEILLKLNLPNHRSILTDSKEYLKMVMEIGAFNMMQCYGKEEKQSHGYLMRYDGWLVCQEKNSEQMANIAEELVMDNVIEDVTSMKGNEIEEKRFLNTIKMMMEIFCFKSTGNEKGIPLLRWYCGSNPVDYSANVSETMVTKKNKAGIALEQAALSDEYFVKRKLAMGFPTEFFPILFAIPRMVGYLSHWRDSLDDPDTKIMRPAQVVNVADFIVARGKSQSVMTAGTLTYQLIAPKCYGKEEKQSHGYLMRFDGWLVCQEKNSEQMANIAEEPVMENVKEVDDVTSMKGNELEDIRSLNTIKMMMAVFCFKSTGNEKGRVLGIVYIRTMRAMGFPTEFFPILFAIPRMVGYLSHWRDSLDDPDTKIMRPAQVVNVADFIVARGKSQSVMTAGTWTYQLIAPK
ncbi:RNA-directed DNA polymerase, eukaryota, reverse transcriptase zinc-binding domain protein, partial [Tanacetum coccineum]